MLVRNLSDAGSLDEAEPDAGDFAILGQDNSGVISGGEVTATSPEGMSVNVAAARVVINGTPYSFDATSLTLNASSGAANRFDLVGWTASGPSFITGTASANPEFPDFSPLTFVAGAAVYVGQSVTTIAQERITEKIHSVLASFKRQYTTEDDVVVELSTPAQISGFQILANGRLKWVDSVLRRTAAQAMEFLTSLTVKQPVATAAALIVRAAAGATSAHTVLRVESSGGTSLATVAGDGRFQAPNYRRGSGNPNGFASGIVGDEYVDTTATNPNLMKWMKTTSSGTSGWVSVRSYVANESALPTGALLPWTGLTTDPIPTGFSLCNGANLAVNASTQALADLIGTRFGTAPAGFVTLPDLRNRVVAGASTVTIAGIGTLGVGTVLGDNVRTIGIEHMPWHDHVAHDPGHAHPQPGPYWYYRGSAYHNNWHPAHSSSALPHLYAEPWGFDHTAVTGVTIGGRGGGQGFGIMQETIGMNWLVKW